MYWMLSPADGSSCKPPFFYWCKVKYCLKIFYVVRLKPRFHWRCSVYRIAGILLLHHPLFFAVAGINHATEILCSLSISSSIFLMLHQWWLHKLQKFFTACFASLPVKSNPGCKFTWLPSPTFKSSLSTKTIAKAAYGNVVEHVFFMHGIKQFFVTGQKLLSFSLLKIEISSLFCWLCGYTMCVQRVHLSMATYLVHQSAKIHKAIFYFIFQIQ